VSSYKEDDEFPHSKIIDNSRENPNEVMEEQDNFENGSLSDELSEEFSRSDDGSRAQEEDDKD
jgi:hypothetical protein